MAVASSTTDAVLRNPPAIQGVAALPRITQPQIKRSKNARGSPVGAHNFEEHITTLELHIGVGIGGVLPSTSHSKSTAYGIADVLNIRLLRFMSSLTTADFF